MGNQRKALRWLIDHCVHQGYAIEPGHLLMTGSLGKVHDLCKGSFEADFGTLGRIRLPHRMNSILDQSTAGDQRYD